MTSSQCNKRKTGEHPINRRGHLSLVPLEYIFFFFFFFFFSLLCVCVSVFVPLFIPLSLLPIRLQKEERKWARWNKGQQERKKKKKKKKKRRRRRRRRKGRSGGGEEWRMIITTGS